VSPEFPLADSLIGSFTTAFSDWVIGAVFQTVRMRKGRAEDKAKTLAKPV
jgi:hypothetical protein